ncbi:hypothetical protein [Sorangium sp. So ce693]|uniref:hypothetical protein n=1 Tax=Sorangium sp. So ce693 TaxID=3133318 RepID=UPI003F62FF20
MEMTLLRMRIAVLAALTWGSACGGNVVVDEMPDGSGGAGATSTSTSTSAVGVGVTSAGSTAISAAVGSTGVGGGDLRSTCFEYCELFELTCGVAPRGCRDFCEAHKSAASACNDLLDQFFDCAVLTLSCDFPPPACELVLEPYLECASAPPCGAGVLECPVGSDRVCGCEGSCPGMDLSVSCGPVRGGPDISCDCLVNYTTVGACQDVGPPCDLALRCCGPIFEQFR